MTRLYSHRNNKRNSVAWYYSKPFIILLIIIFILILKGSWGIYRKASQGKELRTVAEQEQIILEEKKQSLESRLQRLGTQTGQESEIRKKFNVSKFDEKLVVIVDREVVATTTEEEVIGVKAFFEILMFWK